MSFECYDLTLEDFLLISIDPQAGFEKITLECNDTVPKLNMRQRQEFVRILFGQDETKEDQVKLTETQKRIQAHKEKTGKDKKDVDDFLQDWHIIE